jgi:copper chaperone NosL
MGVVDARFGSEIITGKGKIYKFDDIICMIDFMKSESISEKDIRQLLVVDYIQNESFINAREAVFLWSRELHSPMNGNSAAFTSREKAEIVRKEKGGEIRDWNDLYKELN